MSERVTKILAGVGLLLVAAVIGYIIYITFFRAPGVPEEVSPPISQPGTDASTLPSSQDAGDRITQQPLDPSALPTLSTDPTGDAVATGGTTQTTPITLTRVQSPALNKGGNGLNYYDPNDGKFYTVDSAGNIRSIFTETFPNAESIVWSRDADKAVVEFPDGANVVADFRTGNTVTLPQHWEDFQFSPTGDQLISKSIGLDSGNRWLVISDTNGSSAQTIAALGNNANKVETSWAPHDQVVAFSDTGVVANGFGRKQILAIGKNHENFPGLVVEGFSFEPLWSERGTQLLYSTNGPTSGYQPQLWITDGESNTLGNNRRSIPLNTWADKCTFSNDTDVYCAVPRNLPSGSGLQRQLAFGLPDQVYRVDTQTGGVSLIATPARDTSMTNLQVSADGSILFYQNATNGRLEQMRLR